MSKFLPLVTWNDLSLLTCPTRRSTLILSYTVTLFMDKTRFVY